MRLIDEISPKKLRKLYWQRKMSSPEIARIYHCHQKTIRRWLTRYGIKIRTASEARTNFAGIAISRKKLKKLYFGKKATASEVAERFNCCQRTILNKLLEYRIPIRTVSEASALLKSRYPQKDFDGNLKKKSYLIGFRLGDLSTHSESKNSHTVYVRGSSTKPEFACLVNRLFSPYGHVWNKPNKGQINIKCFLNRSFNFLLPKKDLIEPWILKNRKCFAAFMAGYVDAEGYFHISKNGKSSKFGIQSEDKNILFQISKKLNRLGILCRPPLLCRKKGTIYEGIINNEDEWQLSVGRKDSLLKLIKLIRPYSKHPEKQKKIMSVRENILERYKKFNIYQNTR